LLLLLQVLLFLLLSLFSAAAQLAEGSPGEALGAVAGDDVGREEELERRARHGEAQQQQAAAVASAAAAIEEGLAWGDGSGAAGARGWAGAAVSVSGGGGGGERRGGEGEGRHGLLEGGVVVAVVAVVDVVLPCRSCPVYILEREKVWGGRWRVMAMDADAVASYRSLS
jgi:hypothetical protein